MEPDKIDIITSVLILQHPQEPYKDLGSAHLAHSLLPKSKLVVGLSWPNLEKAWKETCRKEDWIVLYLGSVQLSRYNNLQKPALLFTDRKNNIVSKEENEKLLNGFKKRKSRGIILIDGTWSQAKTIWWRNAWLNRLQRCVLLPPGPSLYGKLRKEPKKESQSTIETIAHTLSVIENDSAASDKLIENFKIFLKKFRK